MTVLAISVSTLVGVVIAALVAGIGVTATFSLCLLGAARAAERRRTEESAAAWTALAVIAGVGVICASALGIYAVAAL